jgi:hypothetical protein
LVFPLSQLDILQEKRKIYFYDNVSIIKKIESKIPNLVIWEEISAQLRRNFVFHESCHFVSRSAFLAKFKDELPPLAIKIFIEESFSNACELVAVKDVKDGVHAAFFEFNSYIVHFEAQELISQVIDELGFDKTFQWIWLSYLHCNFLMDRLSDKSFSRLLSFLRISDRPTLVKKLKSLNRIALQLNPDFLNSTTSFYLKYNLISKKIDEIKKIDFMEIIENDDRFGQLFSELSSLI